jgi:prepilin-type N-terminal cleavage/methylation domain-containing protein
MKKQIFKKSGFTLLETIVAIGILAMAMSGPIALSARLIGSAMNSSNQTIAFYLAQEGVEFIRNRRDENFLQGRDWMFGMTGASDCFGSAGCYVDVFANNGAGLIAECPVGGCPFLKYDDMARRYNYQSGQDQIFKRTIQLVDIQATDGSVDNEVKIAVTISWNERAAAKTFLLEEHIFKWR